MELVYTLKGSVILKKQFKRFFCFFMCLCLCFAWFGPSQEVHASGGALVGILLMFLVGAGIGFGINGTAHSLADGFEELVKSYETNDWDGELDFWDVIAIGSSIGPTGELLLNKAATDALNGFMNWLQSDKGWTEGSVIEDSVSVQTLSNVRVYYEGEYTTSTLNLTKVLSTGTSNLYDPDGEIYSYSLDEFSYNTDSQSGLMFPCKNFWYYLYWGAFNDDTALYACTNGSSGRSAWLVGSRISSLGYSLEDIVGYAFSYAYTSGSPYLYCYAVTDSNRLIRLGSLILASPSYVSSVEYQNTISIDFLNIPDTSDWDDVTSLGLFTGHSGAIPQSVEEYNSFVLSDLNSGVVPEIYTDIIVGSPDDILPDEEDGTLAGTVSGILAQVMALPQTLANLILDGVKSIFIPDPGGLETEFMGLLDEINDKYAFDFDLDSLFAEGRAPDEITGYYPIAGKEQPVIFVSWYYLKKGVEFFRPYIRGFIVLMLIFYNLRQFMAIFGLGGVMNGDSGDHRRNDLAV